MEVAYERHRSLSISDAPTTSAAMRASPLLPPGSGPYNPASPAGSFGAARTRSRSASFSTYCPPPIVVPSNNSSDPAFPGSTSPSPSGYPGPAFPGSSCSPSPQDFGLSSCENSPAFPGHSPSEFFQARTVVRSPNQELVRQRAAESADMDSQWEMPPSPAARTPCTCRRNPCACAILSKRASRAGPPLSTSGWGRRLRRSLSGGTSAGNSDSEGGAEPRRSRSLLLRPSKTIANGNATSDTEDMGYGSSTGGESGRSTTGRRAQFARLFTRTGTAPPRPSASNGFHSGSLEGIFSPNHAAPCAAANHVSPPAASRGFVARCASVDAAAAGMFGGSNGGSSNAERPGRPSSATSQKYSRSPSPTSSGSYGAATKGIWRITASSVTSPPPADLSPESLPTGPNHPSRGASPVPRVISIDNAVAWLNSTRKGQSQGRRSADGAATDGASPASRAPARRASFGGGSSRATNASIGSVISANEDDLSRAWDDFTASAAAAATGTFAGDSSASNGGLSYSRRAEQQAAVARKRQPQSQQKASGAAQQNAFRPSASCGSLTDLVRDNSSPVECGGGGNGGGGFGGGYGSDFSKPSKSKGNMKLGATHPPSRRSLSRPTPPPPRPNSPNAAPRPTHSRSPSASGAVSISPPGRGGESTEPIRFRVNTNGRIYRSHTTPASLAPSASASASASSSAAAAAASSSSSRTRHCVIPNSLSLQDPCEPTDLLNSPTIGRSIPEPGNDTSAPAAATSSSSGVSPPNRGERRPTRQVSFNELVRVRRIPRHFFSADMTAAAMDLVSGNDPTAGNATGGSASQGTAGWQSINGVHASSAASAALAQGPVGAESPGGRAGGRKGESASAPAPAPARSSAHAAASAAPTQPRSAAPTSSPAPAPAPALVPTPPPGSSAGGAGGARRVGRSGSWSSTGGSAAARNALPSGASDGSGRDGSSGGIRAANNNGINNNGVSPTPATTPTNRVGGTGVTGRGSGVTDGEGRVGGNGSYASSSGSTGGGSGMGGRNAPAFGETGGRGAAGLGAVGSGAPVRHARSRSFVERSGNDVARMAALAAAAGGVAGGGGNGRGAGGGGIVARCSSVSLSDRPTADVSSRSGGSSSSGSIPLRRNSDRPERANRSERFELSERAERTERSEQSGPLDRPGSRNLSVCPPSPGTRRDAFLGKPEMNGCSSAGSTSSSSTFSSSSSSSTGSGSGTGGTGGDGGSGSTVRNSSGSSSGSGGNRVPGPSVTSPPAPRFSPHPPSAATRSPASSARAAAAAAAARGAPSHTFSADRLPLQGTGTFQGVPTQGPVQGSLQGSLQGPQGPLQHPPQSPHQKLSSQGLPLRSPRHARHHSMGSAAALAPHPSPRAAAPHATAHAAAATAGLVPKGAGDSVPRPRMPPSVLVGISQSLRSLSVQSVQSPSTPRSPRSHSVQTVQSPPTPRSPGPQSPPPHSPRSSAPLSPRSSAPLSPRSFAAAPLSPRASAPLSPRSFSAAPLSPRSSGPAPLSPRSYATPLSPRSFATPLSPRSSAPLSPRASAPLSPRASAPLSPRTSAPLSPRSSAPLSPRFPATRSSIPRSNTTTRTPFPPSAASGFKAPAAPDQSRARNAPAPRRHVRSASVAEVTCT